MEWQITESCLLGYITDYRISYKLLLLPLTQGLYIKRIEKRNSTVEIGFKAGDESNGSGRLLRNVPNQAQFWRDLSHGLNHISHMFP